MNCIQARARLDELITEGMSPEGDLLEHTDQCDLCRYQLSDKLLTHSLQQLPTSPMRDNFRDLAIKKAILCGEQASHRRSLGVSAAAIATFFIGIFLTWVFFPMSHNTPVLASKDHMVILSPHEVKNLHIMIEAEQDRENASLIIQLTGNLEIVGYPDRQSFTWKTNLVEGKNLLTLPLVLNSAILNQTSSDQVRGAADISYSHNQTTRKLHIVVVPKTTAYNNRVFATHALRPIG